MASTASGPRPSTSGSRSQEAASSFSSVVALTSRPFGGNMSVPGAPTRDPAGLRRYAEAVAGEAARYGVELGEPRHDDDGWKAKLELVRSERVPVVSFAFGCPDAAVVGSLREAGCEAWITVTSADEALVAAEAGADALVVQGVEAGGHRGSHEPTAAADVGLLALLQLVREVSELPLVATGGIATGRRGGAALPAGELVRALAEEAREALASAGRALAHRPERSRQDA